MDRILEIGDVAAGYCGRLFVQTGHEVVRVESGAPARGWTSARAMDLYLHAGKRRLRTDDRGLIAALAAKADVVILEADSADAVDSWGFDDLTAPVRAAITPFGRTGPYRNRAATPATILAMGGYTNLMGDADRAPLTLPGHYVEFQAGQFAFTAASACRLADESNSIDIGMLESVMALSQFTTVMWHCAGRIRSRHGSDFWWVVPSNLFACADGWVYVNIVPTFWDPFVAFLDRPDLALDTRFTTNSLRMDNRDALHEIIAGVLSNWSRATVGERGTQARIPIGIVQTFDDVLKDPHLAEREFFQQVSDDHGLVVSPSPPFRFNREPRPAFTLNPVENPDG